MERIFFSETGNGHHVGVAVSLSSLNLVLIFLFLIRLSGIHPFQIEDEEQMLDNIQNGKWNWLGPHWAKVKKISGIFLQFPSSAFPCLAIFGSFFCRFPKTPKN